MRLHFKNSILVTRIGLPKCEMGPVRIGQLQLLGSFVAKLQRAAGARAAANVTASEYADAACYFCCRFMHTQRSSNGLLQLFLLHYMQSFYVLQLEGTYIESWSVCVIVGDVRLLHWTTVCISRCSLGVYRHIDCVQKLIHHTVMRLSPSVPPFDVGQKLAK